MRRTSALFFGVFFALIMARYAPGPATFPLNLQAADIEVPSLQAELDGAISSWLGGNAPHSRITNKESWAVQLTSEKDTLWSHFSTAEALLGQTAVDGSTLFRIASISKTFTVYAIIREPSISLDDPVTKYIPELAYGAANPELVQWDQVTLRSLASHTSGLCRDTGDPCFVWREITHMGFSPDELAKCGLPKVDEPHAEDSKGACSARDVIAGARLARPVFDPNDRATYSNVAFSLLGIVLARATGISYEEAIERLVLDPLEMASTTTQAPAKTKGIIPPIRNDWEKPLGADDATAGFYSSSDDLSKYLRSILNAQLLSKSAVNAWLQPQSWTDSGTSSAYGLGWEILRTTRATYDGRPLTIVGKTGALNGYHSYIMLLPEFGLGLSIMVAGTMETMQALRETVVAALLPAIERVARERALERYAGLYKLPTDPIKHNISGESYIRLRVDQKGPGIYIGEWVSEGKDFLSTYGTLEQMPSAAASWSAKLIPTRIIGDGNNAEMWKVVCVAKALPESRGIFSELHLTDIDNLYYHGRGLGTIHIELDGNGNAVVLHVKALRVSLHRVDDRKAVQASAGSADLV